MSTNVKLKIICILSVVQALTLHSMFEQGVEPTTVLPSQETPVPTYQPNDMYNQVELQQHAAELQAAKEHTIMTLQKQHEDELQMSRRHLSKKEVDQLQELQLKELTIIQSIHQRIMLELNSPDPEQLQHLLKKQYQAFEDFLEASFLDKQDITPYVQKFNKWEKILSRAFLKSAKNLSKKYREQIAKTIQKSQMYYNTQLLIPRALTAKNLSGNSVPIHHHKKEKRRYKKFIKKDGSFALKNQSKKG